MNHSECRDTIAFDEVGRASIEHLESCGACRQFSEDMLRLEQLAAQLAATPPVDLAERIVVGVNNEVAPAATVVPLRRRGAATALRTASRSLSVRVTSAAAVLLLVVALVTGVLQNQRSDPADAVLASAQSTTDAGTAEVRMTATTEIVLEAPRAPAPGAIPAAPDFASAPVELRSQMQAQWEQAMARFEVQLQDFFDQVDQTIGDGTQQMDDALRQMQRQFEQSLRQFGADPDQPDASPQPQPEQPRRRDPAVRPPAGQQPQPPAPPTEVRAQVAVNASGTVDFDAQRIALAGAVETAGSRALFDLAAAEDAALYRAGNRGWTRLPDRAGPVGTLVLDSQAILRVARSASDVTAEGAVEVDGETLEQYTFAVSAAAVGDTRDRGVWRGRAYVGDDGRLRRIELTATGRTGRNATWRTNVSMDLVASGEAGGVNPLPKAARRTTLPDRASLPLYPFNASVQAAEQGGN